MNTWAKPGVQCVCVRDDWHDDDGKLCRDHYDPHRGETYTIHGTIYDGALFLELKEVPIPSILHPGHHVSYLAENFRPLVTTDISQLQSIVRKVFDRKKVDA